MGHDETHSDAGAEDKAAPSHFIRDIIDHDLESGKHDTVVTRFPPEPNGYLHIGHAKSITLNFGLAETYGGRCHLRFDDTNPLAEETEFVEAIERDVAWLGHDWGEHLYFASDYFEQMYAYAVQLVEDGLAYVDSLSAEEISEYRGSFTEPGRPSPYRDRSVEENLDLLERMRAGEFEDGAHVLRAKIDMSHPNMIMRDPPLYRIRHATHHRTDDEWCIYPMYDFAHCLEDSIEDVTHSICTLEFENNRELYDWLLDALDIYHPQQIEFARLNLGYTVLSKRKLIELVRDEVVDGWDDPRMPTIAGLRRRGVTPEAIRNFCHMIGVAKTNSVVDLGKFEYAVRDDLNHRAPRVMGVAQPLKLVVTNFDADEVDWIDAPHWPEDIDREGSRELPFTRELYIERDDFRLDPPEDYYRLAPGREVRLRYGYFVTCEDVVTDDDGAVVEVHCTYDPETRGGAAPDERQPAGTIHWVSATESVPCEMRLYDRLFVAEIPGQGDRDWREDLNPDSLDVVEGYVEPAAADAEIGARFQFERNGYYRIDEDSTDERPAFNRIVTLRDSWARARARRAMTDEELAEARRKKRARKKRQADASAAVDASHERDRVRLENPELARRHERYLAELDLGEEEADVISGDREISDFFQKTLDAPDAPDPDALARWTVNELLRLRKDTPLDELPFGPEDFASLVSLVAEDRITSNVGKEVLEQMFETGETPAAIVEERGLEKIDDSDRLAGLVSATLAEHPDEVARFRDGEGKLMGFFIGQVMRATDGAADPALVRELLTEHLAQSR